MEDRRMSSRNWEQGWSGKPKRHGRPPHPQGPSYQSVPAWEKKFCCSVCRIPWWKICETKKVMSMYTNVFEWDDSGALEAFQNAKSRYWSQINGLPCDIPLQHIDMYIDKVDHDEVIDPELVADLDKARRLEPVESDNDAITDMDRPIVPTGWGDIDDPAPTDKNTAECQTADWNNNIDTPIVPTGWGDEEEPQELGWGRPSDSNNAWNSGSGVNHGDSTNRWSYNAGWEHYNTQNDSWGSGWGNSWNNGRDNSWGSSNRNNGSSRRNGRNRDGGHSGFRSTKMRYQEDDYQTADRWSNSRGRDKTNNSYNKTIYSNQPLAFS